MRQTIHNPRGALMVIMYRAANMASRKRRKSIFHKIWASPILLLYRLITEFLFGYEIPAAATIGKGLFIDHGYGIVINKNCIIGENCRIKHGVTIGCKTLPDGSQGPSPQIGDNVDIGANAIVLGGITIGDNAKIGAGAIVTKNVPSNSTARSPAAIIYSE